jgi:formamidopyrimidine-DNA glycosylase
MPELPEVESVRVSLEGLILHDTILQSDVFLSKMVKAPALNDFLHQIKNQTIQALDRRGKHLIIVLDDYVLMVHLRMEGKFFLYHQSEPKKKHEHLRFYLKSGRILTYEDVRTFGTFHLYPHQPYETLPPLLKAGLEPFDEAFNAAYLHKKLNAKTTAIKASLLDQTVLLGLGNIYADEVLFAAKVHPLKPSNKVSFKKVEALAEASKEILEKAIEAGGTLIRTYHNTLGVDGLFQLQLKVHTKVFEPCLLCQTPIRKIKVSGRSTYYCPTCQKR